jgi:uncharacterized membrane protein (DUF4010 family)
VADPRSSPFFDFGIALLIGALIGIEREKRQAEQPVRGTGGLRTFIVVAEAGAIAAWLAQRLDAPVLFVVVGGLVATIEIAGYLAETRRRPDDLGLTTEIAALVVYLLGGMVLFGYAELAVALGIATSAVLAFKEPLHDLVERLGRDDLYAGLELLIATFIVLPLCPDRPVDPWGALNPYRMWWLVILISSLSLVGYVATRWLGPGRGLPITGLVGGLVSSTAVSLTFARRSREGKAAPADALAAGTLLAWAVMFVRVVVEVAAVNPALLRSLLVPMSALAILSAGMAVVFYRRSADDRAARDCAPTLRNPFSLLPAVQFAALFAAVLLAVKFMRSFLSDRGLYLVAAFAGLTDVDAITLSMASYAREGGDATVAIRSIVLATLTNTGMKLGFALVLGSRALGVRLGAATAVLAVAAVATLLVAG